jgi:uncharacterized cysteine cluster protein YcgN (CxxCxxCC family)
MDVFEIWHTWSASIITIGGGLGLLLSSFYYYTKASKDNRKEEDTTEVRIKELWKERFDLQDAKIQDFHKKAEFQTKEIDVLKEKQKTLEENNYNYVKIFQGRDEDSIKYRIEGREAMQQIRENVVISNKILEAMQQNDVKFNTILQEIQRIYEILANRYRLITQNGGKFPEDSDTVDSVLNSKSYANN